MDFEYYYFFLTKVPTNQLFVNHGVELKNVKILSVLLFSYVKVTFPTFFLSSKH